MQQPSWTGRITHQKHRVNVRCPSLRSLHRERKKIRIFPYTGKRSGYRLSYGDMTPNLQAEIEELYAFLTALEYPRRTIDPVAQSTARNNYLKEILLFLGWFHHSKKIPSSQLNLDLLIPKVIKQDLNKLTEKQCKQLWEEKQIELKVWLHQYYSFLEKNQRTISPRTWRSKLAALSALSKFQYRSEVEIAQDYEDISLLKFIANQLNENYIEVVEWERSNRYVANQSRKWVDPIAGQTALVTIQQKILEKLRLMCCPKSATNARRDGSAIALSQQRYLAWFLLAGMPARRQEEYRDLKVALSCPVKRPSDVSLYGCYYPLPPDKAREQRTDGCPQDNYLYKTYTHGRKYHKEAIWVLDIQNYKMRKRYGPQSIILKNWQFSDGSCLYEYIEQYLYGCWLPGGRKQQHVYDWWQQNIRGRRGRWVSQGRASFTPHDTCWVDGARDENFWSWGYFFLQPRTGNRNSASRFAELVEVAAHHCVGKRITPHIMRSVWATWAYQIGLTDRQKDSLAYAMGHDIKTLKKLYNRTSQQEKRRLIEEAIEFHLEDLRDSGAEIPKPLSRGEYVEVLAA